MGILIASLIIAIWFSHLYYCLVYLLVDFASPWLYVHILFQGYMYTGLFITSHDAMHGTISANKTVNRFFGTISSFLFAGLSYKRLIRNHYKHHNAPCDEEDPDFYSGSQNLFIWWMVFMARYTTLIQLLIMAAAFTAMKYFVSEINLIFLWILPAFLGTFQLFYFGTYLPHRTPHTDKMKPHKARTQKRNHILAMLSCYFFGYHHEHHDSPKTPWWQLYKLKNRVIIR